jgi:hypothetical protein
MRWVNIKKSLDAVAINVMRKKTNEVEEDTWRLPRKRKLVTRKRMCKLGNVPYHEYDSRARAWRNGIRSGLKENLSARLGNRRCRTAQIRGNLKWQSRAKPGETPAEKV